MSQRNGHTGGVILGRRGRQDRVSRRADAVFRALTVANQLGLPGVECSRTMGLDDDDGRRRRRIDLDAECGYPTRSELSDPAWYRRHYDHHGMAARVTNIWADECWAVHPDLY